MAQARISLSPSSPPTSEVYKPTVFTELPRLPSRAGRARPRGGTITGILHRSGRRRRPQRAVADALSLPTLDGTQVLMQRAIADRALSRDHILTSWSRTMPSRGGRTRLPAITRAAARSWRNLRRHGGLIRLGAYRAGSRPEVYAPAIGLQQAARGVPRARLREESQPLLPGVSST